MMLSLRAAARFFLAFSLSWASLAHAVCEGELRIELEHDGVYALDHAAIVAVQPGLADCAAADLVLTTAGTQVPLRVVAKAERFGPGDHLEWLGQRLHGPESWFDPYSVTNVYMLAARPGAHARLRDETTPPSSGPHAALERRLHLEQENLMIRLDQSQQKPGEEADVWQWAKMTPIDPAPLSIPLDLADLDPRGDVHLELNFRGLSEAPAPPKKDLAAATDHVVVFAVNGHALATFDWNGRDEIRKTVQVPGRLLKAAGNVLTLHVPKRPLPWDAASEMVDVVMFNWVEARYPVTGRIDPAALPFAVQPGASGDIQLSWNAAGEAVLYGTDGVRRLGAAGGGKVRFAGAAAEVRLYPLTEAPLKPVAVRRVVGSEWKNPAQGYDYLIVSHARLMEAIEPLAEFHRKRGLRVAVIDIDAVYDQYNHGIPHPVAVRNLVSAAWHGWAKKPRFLLLVGDSSFDIRHETYNDLAYAKWVNQELQFPGHFGAIAAGQYKNPPKKLADRNLIPTWQFPSPEGQSASDNWFGAVDGDDWHPVVAVGRFPVVEPEEVKAIVDKTIDYLAHPKMGAWRRDVMFITDEIESFKQASNEIANALGKDGFAADKVYASPEITENVAHQNAIRNGIDEGRLIVHFIGHGGRFIWRTGPPDLKKNNDLFTLDDVSTLKNAGRLPMVLSMTCYSAPFDNPTEDSIGERFLRESDKGAIAVFAASWRNSPSPAFSKSLIEELLTPGATIGEAIVRAKKRSTDRILVEMYNLLGDPAVVLERPHDHARVAFDELRWNPGIAVDLGTADFDGDLVIDWLDAKGGELGSQRHRVSTPRFRLPLPTAFADRIGQARVYAASPTALRDAVGGANREAPVAAAAAQRPWSERVARWWRTLVYGPPERPKPREDTIFLDDFEGGSLMPAAASATPSAAQAPPIAD